MISYRFHINHTINIFQKIVIIQFLFICVASYSQNSWSTEECINYALNHNLKLNDLDYNIKSNQENYRQSIREMLPTIYTNSRCY